jgi:hypothetical protein
MIKTNEFTLCYKYFLHTVFINGIKCYNCSDDFKLLSLKIISSDNTVIYNVPNMDFFNFKQHKYKKDDGYIYYSLLDINIHKYLEIDYSPYRVVINYIGSSNIRLDTNNHLGKNFLHSKKLNDFHYLEYNNYKNNDTIDINFDNSYSKGIIISDINYNNINNISVQLNNSCYIYVKNKLSNLFKKTYHKLDNNTIYIPFVYSNWNSNVSKSEKIQNIKIKFNLNNNNTYFLKLGTFIYNELINDVFKKYDKNISINDIKKKY